MSTSRNVRVPQTRKAKAAATKASATQEPTNEANGALKAAPETSATQNVASEPAHQTHGGYTPVAGPIMSASQLYRGKNVGKGSPGSFPSMQAYGSWLRGLPLAELHRHAVEDARIVAIDDRERLIKRLETEWTGANHREAHGALTTQIPKRPQMSTEQLAELERLKRQMLKGR